MGLLSGQACVARIAAPSRSSETSRRSRRSQVVRAVAEPAASQSSHNGAEPQTPSPSINVIQPISRWPTGVPPAMGGHLMTSGDVAPIATSKGPAVDIDPLYFTYPSADSPVDVVIFKNDKAAAKGLGALLAEEAAARPWFSVALSGGSLIGTLSKAVEGAKDALDLSKWWVLYADERNVPHSSPDSTHGAMMGGAIGEAAQRKRGAASRRLPPSQLLAIREGLSAAEAATEYEGRLLALPSDVLPRNADGWPVLDLVLLGVGPDGHVASLFPNSKQLAATEGWVLPVTNSPKPPPERITLSLPVINAARHVVVVALGGAKAEVVQRALEVQSLPGALPVQLVRPAAGRLTWVLDQASAAELHTNKWVAGAKKSDWMFPRSEAPPAQ